MGLEQIVMDISYANLLKTPGLYKTRREWMGVEPTAARNATRHRF